MKTSISLEFINIKRIIRNYYEQIYGNKLNVNEMNKFLERHKSPTFTQEEIDNLNIPLSINLNS